MTLRILWRVYFAAVVALAAVAGISIAMGATGGLGMALAAVMGLISLIVVFAIQAVDEVAADRDRLLVLVRTCCSCGKTLARFADLEAHLSACPEHPVAKAVAKERYAIMAHCRKRREECLAERDRVVVPDSTWMSDESRVRHVTRMNGKADAYGAAGAFIVARECQDNSAAAGCQQTTPAPAV